MTERAQDAELAARDEPEFDRGVSYFDAIYGFAATLLVANVDAPSAETWKSLEALAESGVPLQLLGLAVSFIVIAMIWRLNVQFTRRLRGLDGPTTFANLVAAGLVVLLPFTTQGISDPTTEQLALPTALYAINVAAASLSQTLMLQVGRARGLERTPTTRRQNVIFLADALVTPVYLALSIPVAMTAGADAAKSSWLALIVLAPLSGHLAHRAIERARPERARPDGVG